MTVVCCYILSLLSSGLLLWLDAADITATSIADLRWHLLSERRTFVLMLLHPVHHRLSLMISFFLIIYVSNKFDVRCIILCSLFDCFLLFFLSITPLINRSVFFHSYHIRSLYKSNQIESNQIKSNQIIVSISLYNSLCVHFPIYFPNFFYLYPLLLLSLFII